MDQITNQITKIVQEIGNGAHVYLPKEMVGQKVAISLVEKTIEDIEKEVIDILRPYLKNIIGIYLYGSYARGEQTSESDIDILVITDGKVRIEKKINEYDIVSGSIKEIEKTIKNNAVLILPILKEAKAIINEQPTKLYKYEKITKKNTKWYIETTVSSLKLAKEWIEEKDLNSIPHITYTLVMRLRGLYLIETLIRNRAYSNKEFIDFLNKAGISSEKAKQIYRLYGEHRDNKKISDHSINYQDLELLFSIIQKYLKKVKHLWGRLR